MYQLCMACRLRCTTCEALAIILTVLLSRVVLKKGQSPQLPGIENAWDADAWGNHGKSTGCLMIFGNSKLSYLIDMKHQKNTPGIYDIYIIYEAFGEAICLGGCRCSGHSGVLPIRGAADCSGLCLICVGLFFFWGAKLMTI